MLYDVRLKLQYDYDFPVAGGRHLIRVMPMSRPGLQRVIAAALSFDPQPNERADAIDFFGNSMTSIAFRAPHGALSVLMNARVSVERFDPGVDLSTEIAGLGEELARLWSVKPDSPHHFIANSPRVAVDQEVTAFAREATAGASSAMEAVQALGRAIHDAFAYDVEATTVDTLLSEAFALKRGVCQDFAHVMIAGLRGLGIPAGYVSGFLRTLPPPGKPRLEGADAMHAWVRAFVGGQAGWFEYDPTNAMPAGTDHITIGYGRDYDDISPIVGILKGSGSHEASQSVDVEALDAA